MFASKWPLARSIGREIQSEETELAGRHLQLPAHRRMHHVGGVAVGAHAPGDQAALRGVEPQLGVQLCRIGLERDESRAERDDVGAAARELVSDRGVDEIERAHRR